MSAAEGRLGVLVIQLGGPENRAELKPFLYELFADPEILGIPFAPLRKTVAWLIATLRASKSALTYEQIGWSPIRRWTLTQARLLEQELGNGAGPAPVVRAGMTCAEPTVERALLDLRAQGVTRLVVLPLYPQYSVTTTRSSFDKVTAVLAKIGWTVQRLNAPPAWYDEPHFVAAHVERIEEAAAKLPDPDPAKTVLVYSAHSLPVSTVVKKMDPYPTHIEASVALVDQKLGNRFRSRLAYQSKVGPVPWIGPATPDVLAELAKEGVKQVIVCPIAFVSDHVETLHDLDVEAPRLAYAAGLQRCERAPSLNTKKSFIDALEAIARP
ncbi:MAG: ferrochelatase, partial [Thermoanaerobaculia bacterium]